MDILVKIKDAFIIFVSILPQGWVSFILRIGIMLILGLIFLVLAWLYLPWRSIFSQTCVAFIVFVISLHIPVEEFREAGKGFLAFVTSLSLLAIIFLPGWIPFWITPKMGNQLRLKKILRYVIWGLFVIQLIIGG